MEINDLTSAILFILSLPLLISLVPVIVIPLLIAIFIIVCLIIHFIEAFYLEIKMAYELTVNGFLKLQTFSKSMGNNYKTIALSFLFCFITVLNNYVSNNITTLIQSISAIILSLITVFSILVFGRYILLSSVFSGMTLYTEAIKKASRFLLTLILGALLFIMNSVKKYKSATLNIPIKDVTTFI